MTSVAAMPLGAAVPLGTEAQVWHLLARAFLPPTDAAVAASFVADLPGELAAALGSDGNGDIAALQAAIEPLTDPPALLVDYSRCFLPPTGRATLNLSRYVDSGPGGACMDAIEQAYAARGLECSEALRDHADHAARQFDFMGLLAALDPGGAEPRGFAQLCLVGALPALRAHLEDTAPRSPFTALARIAERVVARHAAPAEPDARSPPNRRHDRSLGVWRYCPDCDRPYAREKEIAIMTTALERAGLPAGHLSKCPDCRDRAQGFFRREIA